LATPDRRYAKLCQGAPERAGPIPALDIPNFIFLLS
jgi:hypothetical protein